MAIDFRLLQPAQAFNTGFEVTDRLLKAAAEKHAGKKLAAGDRAGASAAMAGAGYIEDADKITQSGLNQASTAANTRRVDQQYDQDADKTDWAFVQRTTNVLQDVRKRDGDGAIGPAFDQIVPMLRTRGITDEQVNNMRTVFNDPARAPAALDALSRAAADKLVVVPEAGMLADQTTGEVKLENVRDPPAVTNLGRDDTLVETSTGEVRATGRSTPEEITRILTSQEAKDKGFRPGVVVQHSSKDGYKVLDEPPAAKTGTGENGVKISPQTETQLQKYREGLNEVEKVAGQMGEFINLNRKWTGTGGLMAAPMVKDAVGAFDSDVARMNSITDYVVPNMRQGMPGAVTERDARRFENAAVSVSKPLKANEMTFKAFQALYQRMQDRIDFFEQYALRNGTLIGAQGMWNRFINDPKNDVFIDAGPGVLIAAKPVSWRDAMGWDAAEGASSPSTPAASQSAKGTTEDPIIYDWDDPNSPTRKLVRKN